MKKLKVFSVVLATAVLMSACSSKTSETTASSEETTTEATTEVTETTEETTEATTEATETSETEAAAEIDQAFENVAVTDYVSFSKAADSIDYIPQFTIEDEAFGDANKKITEFCESVKKSDASSYVRFAVINVSSREFTLVVYGVTSIDVDMFISFTVDTSSSEILTNDDILALGGEPSSELFEDAEYSISAIMSDRAPDGDTGVYSEDTIDKAISTEKINTSMLMFLGHNYRIFLGSDIPSLGGANAYFEIYDLDGNGYSSGGNFEVAEISDYFLVQLRSSDEKGDQLALAKRNGNDLEIYDVVNGELKLVDKIAVDGKLGVNKYQAGLSVTKDDGTTVTYTLDNTGKIEQKSK